MSSFSVKQLSLPGVLLITPEIRRDERGFSVKVYNPADFKAFGVPNSFAEEFASCSKKGVLRGLHYQQAPHMQDKLVRVAKGEIFDVAADCDPSSETYGKHISVRLSDKEQGILFIPGKYAHGFCVVSDEAVLEYKLSDSYFPELVGGACYDDPILGIDWPAQEFIISKQDKGWTPLKPRP